MRGIPGFPCPKGKVYRVEHALYGLHQSVAKCIEEVNKFFFRSLWVMLARKPSCVLLRCFYTLILLYVDVVVLATNSEEYKTTALAAFDEKYGFKDGGLSRELLGVQVEQMREASESS